MWRWLGARAAVLSFVGLITGLSETPPDEVGLLQVAETKVISEPSERQDSLEDLSSAELQRSLGLASPSLSRFWSSESSAGPPVPWFYSHLFDDRPFGTQVPLSSRLTDVAPPWFSEIQTENEKSQKLLRQRSGPLTWPLTITNDATDYGQILKKIIVDNTSITDSWSETFALETLHGKYLEVGSNLSVFANESALISDQQLFVFIRVLDAPSPVFLASVAAGCCVMADKSGGLVVQHLDDPVRKLRMSGRFAAKGAGRSKEKAGPLMSFVFRIVEEEGHVALESANGFVAAGLDQRPMVDWRSAVYANSAYEVGDHLAQQVARGVLPRIRMDGAISGSVILWLCCLVAFNIHFARSSKAGAAATSATRLPSFDVARFVLECLVFQVHIGGRGLWIPWHSQYVTAYRMPAFVFIAGMFGSSMAYESVSKLLCCTLGTVAIIAGVYLLHFCVVYSPEVAWSSLYNFDLSILCGDYWFLVMLALCRIFVTPIFYYGKTHFSLRPVGPFLLTKLLSYILMHKASQWNGSFFGMYNWHNFLAFMPYFALGLLMTPAEWDTFLKRGQVKLACFTYFVMWYLMQAVPWFLRWNRQYCLPRFQDVGCRAHFDILQILEPVTPQLFATDIVLFALRSGITISFVCVVVSLSQLIELVWPRLNQLMAGWGSRTLYAYVLQQYILYLLGGEGRFFNHLWEAPYPLKIVLEVVVPVTANIILSSQGTEYWFRWLLLPYWMKDNFEKFIFSYPKWAEARAKLAAGASAK